MILKDVFLAITNAKASSPPDEHPVLTIIPHPTPTNNPPNMAFIKLLFIAGNIGPMFSNIPYVIENAKDANYEYKKNSFPKILYPINNKLKSIIILAIDGCIPNRFFRSNKNPNAPPSVI